MGGSSPSLRSGQHSPWVMFNSLPMAKLQTLPLTLGGIPCHHRSRTFLEHHLDTKEACDCEFVVTEEASARVPSPKPWEQGVHRSMAKGLTVQHSRDQEINDYPHWAPRVTGMSRTLTQQRRCHKPEGQRALSWSRILNNGQRFKPMKGRGTFRAQSAAAGTDPTGAGAANSCGACGGGLRGAAGAGTGQAPHSLLHRGALGDSCPSCGGLSYTETHAAHRRGQRCQGAPRCSSAPLSVESTG